MLKNTLTPPRDGLDADPVLYGVAAGLAKLFPPVDPPGRSAAEARRKREGAAERPGDTTSDD